MYETAKVGQVVQFNYMGMDFMTIDLAHLRSSREKSYIGFHTEPIVTLNNQLFKEFGAPLLYATYSCLNVFKDCCLLIAHMTSQRHQIKVSSKQLTFHDREPLRFSSDSERFEGNTLCNRKSDITSPISCFLIKQRFLYVERFLAL